MSESLPPLDEATVITEMQTKLHRQEADRRIKAANAGPPSWGRIDPAMALDAARDPREPEVGRFQETSTEPPHGVFYRSCVNEAHGKSEEGKSWVAQFVVAQEVKAGRTVAYVDDEDDEDDEGSVYRRLLLLLTAMGVPEADARELMLGDLFRYHRPNGPLTDAEREMFMESASGASTVVFDGVTEGMSLEGLDGRIEADVAAWHAKATKDLAHAGKCVIVIDHTPHDQKRTLGSQHKKAAISGVSYLVEAVNPINANERGVLRLKVAKDRPASVRREAAKGKNQRWRGDLVVDFSLGDIPEVKLWPATTKAESEEDRNRPPAKLSKAVIEFVTANPGCSGRAIRGAKLGGHNQVDFALEWLISQGHLVTEEVGKQKIAHRLGEVPFDAS